MTYSLLRAIRGYAILLIVARLQTGLSNYVVVARREKQDVTIHLFADLLFPLLWDFCEVIPSGRPSGGFIADDWI